VDSFYPANIIKLIHILLKWKYIQDKNYGRYFGREAILSKKPRHGYRAEAFIWENFHPGLYRDLGHRASLASHMNKSKFLLQKEWRGDKIIDEDVF